MACYYKGLYFVLSGVGTQGGVGHDDYITEAFSAQPALWRVCTWHKNQRLFQIGDKGSETGYAVFDACREAGAIIANGHEHSYARTYTMASYVNQTVADFNATINLSEGRNVAFVSGLGGNSIRSWNLNLIRNEWWAAYAASNNGVSDGPLFCTFKVDGDARRAHCFLTDRLGQSFDAFDIVSNLPAERSPVRRDRTACRQPFFDLAVRSGADDGAADQADAPVLALSQGAAFRFAGVPIAHGARIAEAHLQLFGVRTAGTAAPVFTVRVELAADAAPLTAAAARGRVFTAPAVWREDAEDFEASTVWNSVDLAPLLQQVVDLPGWTAGAAVLVTVHGTGRPRRATEARRWGVKLTEMGRGVLTCSGRSGGLRRGRL